MDGKTYHKFILFDGWRGYSDLDDIDLVDIRKQKENDHYVGCHKCNDRFNCAFYKRNRCEYYQRFKRFCYESYLNSNSIYNKSEKGKKRNHNYNVSEKGRERARRFRHSEKGIIQRKKYNALREQTPERKKYKKEYYAKKKKEREGVFQNKSS